MLNEDVGLSPRLLHWGGSWRRAGFEPCKLLLPLDAAVAPSAPYDRVLLTKAAAACVAAFRHQLPPTGPTVS